MSQLQFESHCVIRRPLEVVRAHFLDFDHHIAKDVHKGIEYTLLERGQRQRVRARMKILGITKTDEALVYQDIDGSVVQEFVKGDFAGGEIRVRFKAEGAGVTRLDASVRAPLRGLNKLLKPIIHRIFIKLTEKTIEEDRLDLENSGYQPPPAQGARVV